MRRRVQGQPGAFEIRWFCRSTRKAARPSASSVERFPTDVNTRESVSRRHVPPPGTHRQCGSVAGTLCGETLEPLELVWKRRRLRSSCDYELVRDIVTRRVVRGTTGCLRRGLRCWVAQSICALLRTFLPALVNLPTPLALSSLLLNEVRRPPRRGAAGALATSNCAAKRMLSTRAAADGPPHDEDPFTY